MMHTIRWLALTASLCSLLAVAGCDKEGFMYKDLPVAKGSAEAGKGHTVTLKGAPLALAGPGIKIGDKLRDVKVADADLNLVNLMASQGSVRILNIVPSLDTAVCEQQTHYLSEKNNGLDKTVELYTISIDTPFAQKRFAKEAKINNIKFYSDYRGGDFGKAYGLLVEGPHLLARTIMVVDKDNVIRYMQITPELAEMPDMEAAFKAAKALTEKSS